MILALLLFADLFVSNLEDRKLTDSVREGVELSNHCRVDTFKRFQVVEETRTIVVRPGTDRVCSRPGEPTSYVAPAETQLGVYSIYVCPNFRDLPDWLRGVVVLHEQLHLYGVRDTEPNWKFNYDIVEACGRPDLMKKMEEHVKTMARRQDEMERRVEPRRPRE